MARAARWLLVLLLLGELMLLSRQVSQRGKEGPLMAGAGVSVLGPLARSVSVVGHAFGSIGESLHTRRAVMKENEQLHAQVEELQRQLMRLQTVDSAFLRLADAVGYARRSNRRVEMADVVYADYASWLRSVLLYTGEHPAHLDQPVVENRGLVGRVVAAGGGYAKVQLLTDRSSAVGAMIERTGRQGVARGDGHAGLELEYVPLQADVRPGDRVVTAGIDGIYPRGLPLGIVREVGRGSQIFHTIKVVPLVDFGSLDHVYLLPPLPDARLLSESLSRDLR